MISLIIPAFSSTVLLVAYVLFNVLRHETEKDGSQYPRTIRKGWTWLGNLAYFTDPWKFMSEETKDGAAMFQLANLKIVALSAAERDEQSLTPSYLVRLRLLTRDYSSTAGVDVGIHGSANRRVTDLLNRERLVRNIPMYLSDIQQSFDQLGSSGITNPFESVYSTFFRMSVRTLCPLKVAEDLTLCAKVARILHTLDNTGTPATVLFPWFMGPDRIKRIYAMSQFFLIIRDAVQDRIKEGRCDEDPLQLLLDKELTLFEITQFCVGALFAASANTGHIASYLVSHLAVDKKWADRVRNEFAALTARSSSTTSSIEGLSDLSLDDWETSMPSLALCLKETLRLYIATPLPRLNNTGADHKIGNVVVPRDALVVWHLNDVHHNPDVYLNPMEWDPERFNDERAEDSKSPSSFVGWGLGTHVCLGSRFAKLEISLFVAAFMTQFDLTAVDVNGKEWTKMPPASQSCHVVSSPKQKVLLKYTRKA